MRSVFAQCTAKGWFFDAVPGFFSLLGAAIGYFAAQQFNPIALIVIFTVMGLVCNRFSFGTPEMYVFIMLWTICASILCPIKPFLAVAIIGFVAGHFFAFAVLERMDEPNKIEATRQAQIEHQD